MLPPKMLHREFESPEELQDIIKCFWYNKRDYSEEQSNFEVIPDGYAEIIFYFGPISSVSYNGIVQTLHSPFLMGLLNQPATINATNCVEILAVRCFPWTVFDILGLTSEITGVHIFEHPIAQLQEELSQYIQKGKVEEAIDRLKQYFLNIHAQIPKDSMLFNAGILMRKTKGSLPVKQIAEKAYTTVRTLERKFKKSSGHTVKDVSALIRFEQVRNQLWVYPDSNIAAIAQEFGYTDQAHLSKEFKRYSGTTPAAFARKIKKWKP